MGKLTLNLDQLAVDSFDTAPAPAPRGTVFGEQCTCPTNCTCPGCPTCDHTDCDQATCQATCADTCEWSCDTCWYPCGTTNGNYTCDPTITGGGVVCDCCPI